jgi:hypothetical protein
MPRTGIKFAVACLAALATLAAAGASAQDGDWVTLGEVHDRIYLMNRPSRTAIDGGFTYGVFTDKKDGAPADALPGGKTYRSSFLTVEVNCANRTYRIARARFYSDSKATGTVVSEDNVAPGEGWATAHEGTIGAVFVSAGCD